MAAVGTAMIVPFLVPGFGSKAIFDISATNDSDRVRIDPLASIKASLERNTPVEVFQVRSDVPAYWRMLALSWNAEDENWVPDFTDLGEAVTADTLLAAGSPGTRTVGTDVHGRGGPRVSLAARGLSATADRRHRHDGPLQRLDRHRHAR